MKPKIRRSKKKIQTGALMLKFLKIMKLRTAFQKNGTIHKP